MADSGHYSIDSTLATRLGAFWECRWVHGIDPRNPGHANDIAPEILEELEHFGSVEPEPARTPLPNGNDQAAVAAIDCGGHQASSRPAWHHPSRPASPGAGRPGGPADLAALEARNAAERQAQLRHAPREAAAERAARATGNAEPR